MPLKAGRSRATFEQNVRETMHAFQRTGRIGNSQPRSKAKAVKQAVAIAYRQKRKTIGHG